MLGDMAIQRMDNVAIVVDDLDAAVAFFAELGLELEGRAPIEGLFAEAKQNHCMSRAKYRGRSKVQIQAYLCAMVQNLKRLLFLLYQCLVAWWLSKRP